MCTSTLTIAEKKLGQNDRKVIAKIMANQTHQSCVHRGSFLFAAFMGGILALRMRSVNFPKTGDINRNASLGIQKGTLHSRAYASFSATHVPGPSVPHVPGVIPPLFILSLRKMKSAPVTVRFEDWGWIPSISGTDYFACEPSQKLCGSWVLPQPHFVRSGFAWEPSQWPWGFSVLPQPHILGAGLF